MERDYTLYQHFCKVTKKSYIGITKQKPQNRWGIDGKKYKSTTHFGRAIRKYGWDNFEHIILATNLTEEEAKQLEQTCILAFETYGNDGYNSTFGGDGTLGFTGFTRVVSQETREKISKANKGRECSEEHRKKIGESLKGKKHPMYNKHWSKEARQHMSEAHKGKKFSEEYKQKLSEAHKGKLSKKVGQYTLDGKLVKIYNSMTETKNYGYSIGCVSECCIGKRKKHKGYIWKFI